ncbi:hypothetical protein AcW2_000629 [Taiwanofungus camphoratus]|nr:hypothetical protein AcW2_000629 [Antrodia cinnamomea]
MVDGVSDYHLAREKESRKRKRYQKATNDRARDNKNTETRDKDNGALSGGLVVGKHDDCDMSEDTTKADKSSNTLPKPVILDHLTVGINEVTKVLERMVRSHRQTVTAGKPTNIPDSQSQSRPRLILVCRADVEPPILIEHLPHLVAACNSSRCTLPGKAREGVWLLPLPKGAELALAEAMGLRRVSAMAIHDTAPEFLALASLLGNVPFPTASWLIPQVGDRTTILVPTHIKQLRTTAPKDMKATKEQRSLGRAAAKERNKRSKAVISKRVNVTVGSVNERLYHP